MTLIVPFILIFVVVLLFIYIYIKFKYLPKKKEDKLSKSPQHIFQTSEHFDAWNDDGVSDTNEENLAKGEFKCID